MSETESEINLNYNKGSYFIKNKALFGSFPTQKDVEQLENIGVKYFVDLTTGNENLTFKYNTKFKYINYVIFDHKIPHNLLKFSKFIIYITNIINNLDNNKIYIHCKGGHGRSGMIVACILCYMYNIISDVSLDLTTKFHNNRKCLKDKWKCSGSPNNNYQKKFIINFFKPIYLNININYIFCLNSPHKIYDPLLDKEFVNCEELLLQYYTYKNNINVNLLIKHILLLKLDQYPVIKKILLKTYLKRIIDHNIYENKTTSFLLKNNLLGRSLEDIRYLLFLNCD